MKTQAQSPAVAGTERSLFGNHPAGLTTLFFTEMWERFSFYGMKALLLLFMVAPLTIGGMALDQKQAALIYGLYSAFVYLTALPGGIIADRWLGRWNAVLVGGVVIAIGHFVMVLHSSFFFFSALVLIVAGTGLLKPNITNLVGSLYARGDARADSGFAIYYMGINIGATLAPIVCGFLAQSQEFKSWLSANGFDPNSSWHWGFAAAGVGMVFGLVQFVLHRRRFSAKMLHQTDEDAGAAGDAQAVVYPTARWVPEFARRLLTVEEWKRLAAIAVLFVFSALFWAIYEQGGSSLAVFADKLVANELFGWTFPSSWFQSLQAVFVILMTPVFAVIWSRLGKRGKNPSSPAKFALGLLLVGLGIALAVPAAMAAAAGRISPWWLFAIFALEVAGEMCLSPVGLRTVSNLAPRRFAGLTMGIWFLSVSLGNFMAGWFAGFFNAADTASMVRLFATMAGIVVVASLVLFVLTPVVRKLAGDEAPKSGSH